MRYLFMMSIDERLKIGFVCLVLAACGDEAIGESDDGAGTQATSADPTAGTTMPPMTATTLTAGGPSTTGDDTTSGDTIDPFDTTGDSTGDTTTGSPAVCEGDGNCSEYSPCDSSPCGTLDSPFDDDGCLRETCGIGSTCGDAERCYHAEWFGGCASSGFFCMDDPKLRQCSCNALPDCGGAYCVPASLWPMPDAGPTTGQIDDACAPDDGPATELMFGGLGTCPMDEPSIRLVFFSAGPAVGSYVIESQSHGFGEVTEGGGAAVGIVAAWVEITALGGGTASGTYEVISDDAQHYAAEFTDIPYCQSGFPCG